MNIEYLSKVLPDIGKIIKLPPYYYIELLDKIKYIEEKIDREKRHLLLRLYDVLKYIGP